MKLTVPQIEVADGQGFEPSVDIFGRSGFGTELMKLVESCDDEVVIAIDAPWGEGKTTFVKMWRAMLAENEIQSISHSFTPDSVSKDGSVHVIN